MDIRDVSERLIRILLGQKSAFICGNEPQIIVTEDITPSETAQLENGKTLALVTTLGSMNSHSAIFARNMEIPAITGIEIRDEWNGKQAIVDGQKGILYIDPDEDTLEEYALTTGKMQEQKEALYQFQGLSDVTRSGKEIGLFANIGSESEISVALENDAKGIGLFRSEFLYLGKEHFPTEEEQYEVYKQAVQRMEGRKVIIRTMDLRQISRPPIC